MKQNRSRRIEDDTPILPNIVAERAFWSALQNTDLSEPIEKTLELRDRILVLLEERANRHYNYSLHFRNKVNGSGNSGRDYLYRMMQHWTYSLLKENNLKLLTFKKETMEKNNTLQQGADEQFCKGYERATLKFAPLLKAEKAKIEEYDKALVGLTPGGSEFVGNITNCVNHIKDRFESNHRITVEAIRARKAAESKVEELTKALKRIADCENTGLKLDASDAKGFIKIAKAAIQ